MADRKKDITPRAPAPRDNKIRHIREKFESLGKVEQCQCSYCQGRTAGPSGRRGVHCPHSSPETSAAAALPSEGVHEAEPAGGPAGSGDDLPSSSGPAETDLISFPDEAVPLLADEDSEDMPLLTDDDSEDGDSKDDEGSGSEYEYSGAEDSDDATSPIAPVRHVPAHHIPPLPAAEDSEDLRTDRRGTVVPRAPTPPTPTSPAKRPRSGLWRSTSAEDVAVEEEQEQQQQEEAEARHTPTLPAAEDSEDLLTDRRGALVSRTPTPPTPTPTPTAAAARPRSGLWRSTSAEDVVATEDGPETEGAEAEQQTTAAGGDESFDGCSVFERAVEPKRSKAEETVLPFDGTADDEADDEPSHDGPDDDDDDDDDDDEEPPSHAEAPRVLCCLK